MVCDLELWASDIIFVCNTSSCLDNHLCHIVYKTQHRCLSYGQTRTGSTKIYAQILSADCDIDLWPSDMVLVHDTLFCHDDHLYQIIFKSHHAWKNYGSDMNKLHWSLCTKFKSRWTLTYNLATWFLFAKHHFIMMIVCANLFFKIPPWQSYWPNTKRFHWSLCTKFNSGLWPWPLT